MDVVPDVAVVVSEVGEVGEGTGEWRDGRRFGCAILSLSGWACLGEQDDISEGFSLLAFGLDAFINV